jgi:hypothetical protein
MDTYMEAERVEKDERRPDRQRGRGQDLGPGRKEHETRAFSKSFVIWLNKFFKTGY